MTSDNDPNNFLKEILNNIQNDVQNIVHHHHRCQQLLNDITLSEATPTQELLEALLTYESLSTHRQGRLKDYSTHDFYELFVHDSVTQRMWNYIIRALGASHGTKIEKKIGLLLFQHNNRDDDVPSIRLLFSKFHHYGSFLINQSVSKTYIKSNPTQQNIKDFLDQYNTIGGGGERNDREGSTNGGENTPGECPIFANVGIPNTIQQADTVKKLLKFLPSAHIADNGSLMMSKADTLALLTSPYVVGRHVMELKR